MSRGNIHVVLMLSIALQAALGGLRGDRMVICLPADHQDEARQTESGCETRCHSSCHDQSRDRLPIPAPMPADQHDHDGCCIDITLAGDPVRIESHAVEFPPVATALLWTDAFEEAGVPRIAGRILRPPDVPDASLVIVRSTQLLI